MKQTSVAAEIVTFAAVLAVSLAAAHLFLGTVATDGLIGWDAYPLIASAEGGLSHALATELMDGRYPDGRFYRPLVTLTLAQDTISASDSLDAGLFRLTDLLACALGAAMVGMIAARVASERAGGTLKAIAAGIAAALCVVLHRAQLDIVPFVPRRADGMCAAFLAATAYLSYRGAKPWALGITTLLAVLSKETGVIAVPLTFAAAWARPRALDEVNGSAIRDALLTAAVPGAAVGAAVLARLAVLGEIGGHAESGGSLGDMGRIVIEVGQAGIKGIPGGALAVGALLSFLGVRVARLGAGRALLLPLAWAALTLAITSVSGRTHEWYAIHLAPPLGVSAGIAVAAGLSHGSRSALGAALVGLSLVGLVVAGGRDPERMALLDHASRVAAEQERRFTEEIEGLEAGSSTVFAPFFFAASDGGREPQVFIHAPYSLSALAELRRKDIGVEVLGAGFVSRRDVTEPKATVQLSAPILHAR